MDIIIQSLGFKASSTLEDYIREKLEKLDNHTDKIVRADVTLFLGPDSQIDNKHCEIRLEVPGNDHFVKKNCPTFEQAIAEAEEVLQKIIKRYKGKERSDWHATDNSVVGEIIMNNEASEDDDFNV